MPERVSILAVLVLYRRALAESTTWQTLIGQVDRQLTASVDFRLLVCDNGPPTEMTAFDNIPDWVEYVAIRENRGLAWAYNLGLSRAQACGAEWLLTLDQDTVLPADFVSRMATLAMAAAQTSQQVGAIVPQLLSDDGRVHSPAVVTLAGERILPRGLQGFVDGEVRAFNSAALIRVEALEAVGGYDRRFWLDYLDHSLFHSLHAVGARVWIRGDLQLRHELSLHDDREGLSEHRFQNFSIAESAFRDLYMLWLPRLIFTARLLLRAVNQKRRGDAQHFSRTTWARFCERLLVRRQARIARWELEVAPMCAEPQIAFETRGLFGGDQS